MNHVIKDKLAEDSMVRHGLMMSAFNLLAGLSYYLYQLLMGILLSSKEYGTLLSLTSLFTIVIVFSQAIEITVAKFTSKFSIEENWGSIKYLWIFYLKRTALIGFIIFLVLASLTPVLSNFLKLDSNLYPVVMFSSLILIFALHVNYGVLQGLQRFFPLGISQIIWPFLRLSLAVILVYLGFAIYGGLVPYLVATVISFFITCFFLNDLNKSEKIETNIGGLFSYTWLTLLAVFCFAVMVNIDVVLAKHFLESEVAGNYSVIAVLGRIAYYAPMGVVIAMFPKTSELFEMGAKHSAVLSKATLMTAFLGGVVVISYWLFPNIIIDILFGSKYPLVPPYLFKYAMAMALFAYSFLLMSYLLSLNQTKVAYMFIIAMLFEFGLIYFLHDSISQLVNVMLITGIFCLAIVVLFYASARFLKSI